MEGIWEAAGDSVLDRMSGGECASRGLPLRGGGEWYGIPKTEGMVWVATREISEKFESKSVNNSHGRSTEGGL